MISLTNRRTPGALAKVSEQSATCGTPCAWTRRAWRGAVACHCQCGITNVALSPRAKANFPRVRHALRVHAQGVPHNLLCRLPDARKNLAAIACCKINMDSEVRVMKARKSLGLLAMLLAALFPWASSADDAKELAVL